MLYKRPLLLAVVTFAVIGAAILSMMILLSDQADFGVFLPLFAPAGLASWVIYRAGADAATSTE